jgi:hypothetical protein
MIRVRSNIRFTARGNVVIAACEPVFTRQYAFASDALRSSMSRRAGMTAIATVHDIRAQLRLTPVGMIAIAIPITFVALQ